MVVSGLPKSQKAHLLELYKLRRLKWMYSLGYLAMVARVASVLLLSLNQKLSLLQLEAARKMMLGLEITGPVLESLVAFHLVCCSERACFLRLLMGRPVLLLLRENVLGLIVLKYFSFFREIAALASSSAASLPA
jgi:hypothetical protein